MTAPSTVFIDRDGVLNRKPLEGEYVLSPESLEVLPGAAGAIGALTGAGIRTVIVTNQQGVGKGLLTLAELGRIHDRLLKEIEAEGGRIDQLLVCPHLEGTCECRKPQTGLFAEARRRDGAIDFSDSVVIGDSASDMEAASAIGAQPIRVAGHPDEAGATTVAGIAEAAELILGGEG